MKTTTKFASFCLLSVMLGVPAAADAAGASTNIQYAGRSVYAYASTYGCESSYQIIQGFESTTHGNGGPPSTTTDAYLYSDQFDCNTNTGFYFYMNGSPTVSLLQVANNSSSAILIATMPVTFCDYDNNGDYVESCSDTTASVDLSAHAIGAMYRYNNHYQSSYPDGSHYQSREKGTGSDAQATATITVNGMVIPFGGDYEYASISRNAQGSVNVTPP